MHSPFVLLLSLALLLLIAVYCTELFIYSQKRIKFVAFLDGRKSGTNAVGNEGK
jgi:hypothetical protein